MNKPNTLGATLQSTIHFLKALAGFQAVISMASMYFAVRLYDQTASSNGATAFFGILSVVSILYAFAFFMTARRIARDDFHGQPPG